MVERLDFLRHIVNPTLAKHLSKRKGLSSLVDEIRKLVASAEEKYGFSAFDGEPERLAQYFGSSDFDLLYKAFASIESLDVLEEILLAARDEYFDLREVVRAIDEVLSKIERDRRGARAGEGEGNRVA